MFSFLINMCASILFVYDNIVYEKTTQQDKTIYKNRNDEEKKYGKSRDKKLKIYIMFGNLSFPKLCLLVKQETIYRYGLFINSCSRSDVLFLLQ